MGGVKKVAAEKASDERAAAERSTLYFQGSSFLPTDCFSWFIFIQRDAKIYEYRES